MKRFFCQCELRAKALGEGSVSYLYYPQAISRILEINPRAKFIVMVRNPTEMIYSYHSRLLAVLEENVNDFFTAWNLQDDRDYTNLLWLSIKIRVHSHVSPNFRSGFPNQKDFYAHLSHRRSI